MKFYIQYLAIISILLSSCSGDSKTLPLIDIDNPKGSVDLNLSEILDDIRLINLEMIEDEPIPQNGFQWIGEEHLLYFGRDKVYQYTADGSFVRILMKRGQGPEEFSTVMAYDVDETKDLLYWSNQGTSGKILITDLKSGEQLAPISLPYDTRLSHNGLKLIDENTLLCLSDKYSEEDIMFYYLSMDGTVEEGLPRNNLDPPSSGRGTFLKKNHNSGKFNFLENTDTLYSIEGNTLEPVFSMLVSDRFNYEDNLEGYMLTIKHLGSSYAILGKNMLVVTRNENSTTMNSENAGTFLFDMHSFTLSSLNSWTIDYLAYTSEDVYFTTTDNFAVIKFDALELKAICEESILKKDLDPEVRDRITNLNMTISENDNPYLLIGKIR